MTSLSYRHALFWTAALLLLLAASLIGRPDIPIDETRYVSVAWEAWRSGDWLVMHMNGQPYHHKPPLLFWLIGLGWSVFGVNDWWPRTISALAAIASVALTVHIAARLWPTRHEIRATAGWLMFTSMFWLLFSTSIMFDVLVTVFTLLALLGILDARQNGGWRGWIWCALGLGLGVLAKGPFILLHAIPVALAAAWWDPAGRGGWLWWRRAFFAATAGALIALLWVVPAAIFGGDEFRRAILWGQVAGRVSGNLAHRQPVWFYLPALFVLIFPLGLTRRTWQAAFLQLRQRTDKGTRFILCWTVPALAALSLAGGKQIHYILPIWPALALLAAASWESAAPRRTGGLWLLPATYTILGALLMANSYWGKHLWFAELAASTWIVSGALMLCLGILLAVASHRFRDTAPLLAVANIAATAIMLLGVIQPLSPAFDMTPMAGRIKEIERQGKPVVHVSAYNDQYHYYGRLDHPLAQTSREGLAAWFADHPDGFAIVYLKRRSDAEKLNPVFSQAYLEGRVALIDAQGLPGWQEINRK